MYLLAYSVIYFEFEQAKFLFKFSLRTLQPVCITLKYSHYKILKRRREYAHAHCTVTRKCSKEFVLLIGSFLFGLIIITVVRSLL